MLDRWRLVCQSFLLITRSGFLTISRVYAHPYRQPDQLSPTGAFRRDYPRLQLFLHDGGRDSQIIAEELAGEDHTFVRFDG